MNEKKKMKGLPKRILSFVLTLVMVMVITLIPMTPVMAESGEVTIGNFKYQLNPTDRTATLTDCDFSCDDSSITGIDISTVEYEGITYTVTAVGEYAVSDPDETSYYEHITSVSLPNVTCVGDKAFFFCYNMTSLSLPKVEYIGKSSFNNCYSLSSISLPNVKTIDERGFYQCYYLNSLDLPKVETVGKEAFCESTYANFETINLPEAISIGEGAFKNCYTLKSVILPKATTIGDEAFNYCYNLATISLPEATDIGNYALTACSQLTEVSFPKLKNLGSYALGECMGVTSLLMTSLAEIQDDSLSFIDGASLTLPDTWPEDDRPAWNFDEGKFFWKEGWFNEVNYVHVHNWTYAASNGILTATCSKDASHTATLTLTASDANYSGSSVTANYGSGEAAAWKTAVGSDAPTITYEKRGADSTWSAIASAPSAAGEYRAVAKVTKDSTDYTAYKEFTISKAEISSVTFTEPTIAAAGTPATATGLAIASTANYTGEISWSPADASFGYNKAYTATVTLSAKDNYKFAGTVTVPTGWTKDASSTEASLVLTKTYASTAKAKITSVTVPSVTTQLTAFTTESAQIAALPTSVTVAVEDSSVESMAITWALKDSTTYSTASEAENTFVWTITASEYANFDTNGKILTGEVTLKNPVHQHTWNFTADEAVITATCTGFGDCTVENGKTTGVSLTLSASSANYSGSPITKATLFSGVDFTTFKNATKLDLSSSSIKLYAKSDTSKLTELTDITANGWYVAELTVDTDKTARLEFSVGDINTVTYNANGHGTAPASTSVLNGEKLIAPTNPTASGYTFAGWYKEAECTNAWVFGTDTVTENITLYAKWNQNSGGGGGYIPPSNPDNDNSGNNNSGNTITVPVENGSQSSKVTIEIKDNVAVVDTISDDVIKDTVEKGTTDTITIDASAANTDVHGTALDKQTAEKIADVIKDNSNKVDNLEIKTPQATITLDGTALQSVADAAGAATDLITLVVDDVNNVMNELTSVQQNAIKDTKPLATFDAYILAGKSRVHDLKGGVMTVAVEYPFPNTVSAKDVKLVHMLNDGGTEVLEWKVVTENGKKLTVFNTKSLSYFTFTLDENGVLADTEQEASEVEDTVINPKVAAANALSMNAALRVNQTGNRINVSWGKVEGADGYVVYAACCGTELAKIETIADADTTSLEIAKLDGRKLDLKKNYKVRVVAYKLVDGKKTCIGKTIIAHVVGRMSTKYTNAKSIKLTSADKVTLKAGKTAKIKATIVPVNAEKKQLSDAHAKEFRYASSGTSIATVDANGKITAKKEGKCTIYVYAKNGYAKKVTVTVK